MKHIHITLEDFEYKDLMEVKKETTWHDLLMQLWRDKDENKIK